MTEKYKTLYKYGFEEIEIKRSRFIGHAMPISSEEEAVKFIDEIRAKHRMATHNVYAYVFGKHDEIQRYSDDGEPSGTAGLPVLNVIKKEELKNVVVVVTRYFGGILLGTGGLVRAYIKSAKAGIDSAVVVEKVLFKIISIRLDYTLLGKVQNELLKAGYYIKNIEYEAKAVIYVCVEDSHVQQFIDYINDLTDATAEIVKKDNVYLFRKDNKYIE